MNRASAARGSGFGVAVVLIALLNRVVGWHIDPEFAVGLTGVLVGGGGWVVHHGGISGLWHVLVHGEKAPAPPG